MTDHSQKLQESWERLISILQGMDRVAVAFSAGVDSTFLLYAAVRALGKDKVLALTATSATYPREQYEEAVSYAGLIGCRHLTVESRELSNPEFRENPPNRCYLCKKELFSLFRNLAADNGFAELVEGSNASDLDDFRPGMQALKELGVRSPLLEAGLGKEDIRALSRQAGLPTWNKPSQACLSSRFPYGVGISEQDLARVDQGERFLREAGISGPLRVRHHGSIARLEIDPGQFPRITDPEFWPEVVRKFKSLGYRYVTLDLQGYRTGSMNEALARNKENPGK